MFFILFYRFKNNNQNSSAIKRTLRRDRFSLQNTVKTPFLAPKIEGGDIRALFE